MKFAIGDVVSYHLRDHDCGPGSATVIGYSFPDVCVVADEYAHGMPINEAHCTRTGHDPNAAAYRARYESLYGPLLAAQEGAQGERTIGESK